MTNLAYDTFKEGILGNTAFDLDSDIILSYLIDSADYTFSAAHDELSGGSRDVPAAAIVATSPTLTSPTVVNGVFDTADFTWTSVSGDECDRTPNSVVVRLQRTGDQSIYSQCFGDIAR